MVKPYAEALSNEILNERVAPTPYCGDKGFSEKVEEVLVTAV